MKIHENTKYMKIYENARQERTGKENEGKAYIGEESKGKENTGN